jgi:hypothetical protein
MGLQHAARAMATKRDVVGRSPVITTTIQLLRAVDERPDSVVRHGIGPSNN